MSNFRDYVDKHYVGHPATEKPLKKKSSLSGEIPKNKRRKQIMTDTNPKVVQNPIPDGLDTDQLQAVNHRGSNLLIIAGAGSGKTRTLTHRAVSFLQEIEPENLMVITFTKKAAKKLLDQINEIVPEQKRKSLKRAWIGTIHSICWRMLMENGHLVKLKPNWSVLDMPDSEKVMRLSSSAFGFSQKDSKNLYQLYSYSRNSITDWSQWVKTQRFPDVPNTANVGKAIESYRRRCARSNRVDYDDLQVLTLKLLEENLEVRKSYQDRFHVIMVDEYQDTNLIQAKILELLTSKTNVITVVGDDAQSIYGFRAATVENIFNFEKDFSAERITIKTNYRSTPEIVALSNASIRNNKKQIFKNIRANALLSAKKPIFYEGATPNDEAKFIVQYISKQQGISLNDIAILFRATRQTAALEIELKRSGIPYVIVGGEGFFASEHIKIVLDMARLLIYPDDSIALGALQELMGFSSASTLEVVESQAEQTQLSFWEIVSKTFTSILPSKQPEYKSLISFAQQIVEVRKSIVKGESITPVIAKVLKFLEPYLKKKYANRWDDIEKEYVILQSVASQFVSMSDFLNSVALQPFTDDETQDEKLILSTIHSAKGLEWNTVFVIGLVEFWFPLKWAIQQTGTDEEERRLFYVAVTRAKKELFLSSYSQAMTYEQEPSRFVQELPQSVYENAR
jgi:DNA helicase-2/ATP-dependent DNA helicase PcrA